MYPVSYTMISPSIKKKNLLNEEREREMASFRGLVNFISDIRKTQSKEDERSRVYKEMANIRQKFTQTGKKLTSYDNKKYVVKMCYMWMLGYEVDFGHMEVINLISGLKLSEKAIGYFATTLLIHQNDDLMKLIVNGVRNDLTRGDSNVKALAMACIANTGFKQLSEVVRPDVYRLLIGNSTSSDVRKRAALCLNRVLRATPEIPFPEEWLGPICDLLKHRSLGVVISVMALVLGVLEGSSEIDTSRLGGRIIVLLQQLVLIGSCPNEYVYKKIPCPWLQVKLLRALQLTELPESSADRARLSDVLTRILSRNSEMQKCVNRNNSNHSILFEAINLIVRHGDELDKSLKIKASSLLGRYIQIRDANMRYLGLTIMAKLAASGGASEYIKKHQATILFGLKDPDISIRKRALNLLFLMCDKSNSLVVVKELLSHLANADISIREEMVLKIAILAERYAPNYKWYIDTILFIIKNSGNVIDDSIWHRACQIVSNQEDLQAYAAQTMFDAVSEKQVNEMLVRYVFSLTHFSHLTY